MKNVLGNVIRDIRKSKKLTQKELSELTGFSQNTISNHENMKRSLDELDINIYAKALGVTPQYLFEQAHAEPTLQIEDNDSNENNSIINIYDQLNEDNKKATYDFAKQKLEEQRNVVPFGLPIKEETNKALRTLAAHSDDPNRTYTEEEIEKMNTYLEKEKKKYMKMLEKYNNK